MDEPLDRYLGSLTPLTSHSLVVGRSVSRLHFDGYVSGVFVGLFASLGTNVFAAVLSESAHPWYALPAILYMLSGISVFAFVSACNHADSEISDSVRLVPIDAITGKKSESELAKLRIAVYSSKEFGSKVYIKLRTMVVYASLGIISNLVIMLLLDSSNT